MKNIMKRKRNLIMKILVLAILLFSVCACNEKDETVKIGVVGTMTGSQSDLSVSGRRGIEIAVDEINGNGGINGRQIELIVKNDENNPDRAAEIVKEFVEEEVSYVIGHYTSGMMLAAYDELASQDILYLGPTVSADNLSTIEDGFIRFIASTQEQAQIINDVALRDGHKRFIVIYDQKNIGFNEYLYQNFEALLEENNGLVVETLGFESTDEVAMNDLLNRLDQFDSEYEAIFAIAGAYDLAIIAQEMGKSHIEVPIYGPLWAHTDDLVRIGGSYVEGVRVVSGVDYTYNDESFIDFQEEYKERFGTDLTFASIYSYETLRVLAQAMEENKEYSDIQAIQLWICDREYQGLQGSFYIDSYGDNTRSYMMDEVTGNEFKRID